MSVCKECGANIIWIMPTPRAKKRVDYIILLESQRKMKKDIIDSRLIAGDLPATRCVFDDEGPDFFITSLGNIRAGYQSWPDGENRAYKIHKCGGKKNDRKRVSKARSENNQPES